MVDSLKFTAEGVPKNWTGKDWQAYKFVWCSEYQIPQTQLATQQVVLTSGGRRYYFSGVNSTDRELDSAEASTPRRDELSGRWFQGLRRDLGGGSPKSEMTSIHLLFVEGIGRRSESLCGSSEITANRAESSKSKNSAYSSGEDLRGLDYACRRTREA
jgi:hypothetical protein